MVLIMSWQRISLAQNQVQFELLHGSVGIEGFVSNIVL